MTPPSPFKTCSSFGCNRTIPRASLMCLAHWRLVPSKLQADVYSTLAAWKKSGASLRPYLIARKRAILAVAACLGPEWDNDPAAVATREELQRLEGQQKL